MAESTKNLLDRFLGADSWDEAREILKSHPELLDAVALGLLDVEIDLHQDDPETAASLSEERRFLVQCREIGVEAAFCERMIAACESDLAETSYEEDPVSWAGLTLQLASSYHQRHIGDRSDNLESALAAYERALAKFGY